MSLTAAVIHDVKNRLAELAMRLAASDPHSAALALDASAKLAHLLLAEGQELVARIDAAAPADLLDELAAEYRDLYPGRQIQTDSSASPALWYYDVSLLRMALSNAVHNALRHCRTEVRLAARVDGQQLVLEVRDDGAGFPPALLAGDAGLTAVGSSVGSTGLGLLISRRIAEAHRLKGVAGRLALANADGAVLQIILP